MSAEARMINTKTTDPVLLPGMEESNRRLTEGNQIRKCNRSLMTNAHRGSASFYEASARIGFNRNKTLFMEAAGSRGSRYRGEGGLGEQTKLIPKSKTLRRPLK